MVAQLTSLPDEQQEYVYSSTADAVIFTEPHALQRAPVRRSLSVAAAAFASQSSGVAGVGPSSDGADLARALTFLAAFARKTSFVERILVEGISPHARTWIVIDAPPFEDKYRYAVFEAQKQATRAAGNPVGDVRLINRRELVDALEDVLPRPARLFYQRPSA